MCFEVFLEILVGAFAFFGAFCLVKLIGIIWFGYDNVRISVEIDSPDSAKNIEKYIREADVTCLALGGREIVVLVKQEYWNDDLLEIFEKENLKYYVI